MPTGAASVRADCIIRYNALALDLPVPFGDARMLMAFHSIGEARGNVLTIQRHFDQRPVVLSEELSVTVSSDGQESRDVISMIVYRKT